MKIIGIIPLYAIFSYIGILWPQSWWSIEPWLSLVESVAMATFFLLMLEYVSHQENERDLFFSALDLRDKKGKGPKGGNLVWYRVCIHR